VRFYLSLRSAISSAEVDARGECATSERNIDFHSCSSCTGSFRRYVCHTADPFWTSTSSCRRQKSAVCHSLSSHYANFDSCTIEICSAWRWNVALREKW